MSASSQTSKTSATAQGASFLLEEAGSREVFTPERLSQEQRLILKTAHDFTEKEVWARAAEIDERGIEMMPELLRKAGQLGLAATEIPEEHGGMGFDVTTDTAGGLMHGSPQKIAEDMKQYQDVGVTHFVMNFPSGSIDTKKAAMERFAREVMPSFANQP